jgi:hypothetical protein
LTPEQIAEKLIEAITELGFSGDYAFRVVKDEDDAVVAIAAAIRAERERIKAEVRAIQADYPADVFPSREGQAARHVAERVLRVIDALH